MSNETDLDWLVRLTGGNLEPWYNYIARDGEDAWKCARLPTPNLVWFTKAQYMARCVELHNKPSWEDAPEWATHLGQNPRGQLYFMKSGKVSTGTARYHDYSRCSGEISIGKVLGDWRDTLERRPADMHKTMPEIDISDERAQKSAEYMHDWHERGELPPVGSNVTIVEIDGLGISDLGREFIGEECKVMATFTRPELPHSDAVDIVAVMEPGGGCCCFVLEMIRPTHTERDVLIELLRPSLDIEASPSALADAILAAGFSMRAK